LKVKRIKIKVKEILKLIKRKPCHFKIVLSINKITKLAKKLPEYPITKREY
jgi:hypothetical protein